jgi:hypothetical protein
LGILKKLFGGEPDPAPKSPDEHAVFVHLTLSAPGFGEREEREAIHRLTDRLDAAINAAQAGEFDGDEFGAGTCTLYMYGPDADRLFAAVEPDLRASSLTRGGHAVKRYGAAADPHAREVRVEFEPARGER